MAKYKEVLNDLRLLANRPLNLDQIKIDSIPFGSLARDNIPRGKIVDVTFSPIVASYRGGTGLDPEFFDLQGDQLTIDQVIDSVIDADGMVHYKNKVSFKISNGMVVGFAIYGKHLNHFRKLRSVEDCLRLFGTPDCNKRNEAYGDLMGFDLYYYDSLMRVGWDSFDQRISVINVGDYEGNTPTNDTQG